MFNSTRALGIAYRGIALESLGNEAGIGYSNTVRVASAAIEKKVCASPILIWKLENNITLLVSYCHRG